MKKIFIGLTFLTSMSSFAISEIQISGCEMNMSIKGRNDGIRAAHSEILLVTGLNLYDYKGFINKPEYSLFSEGSVEMKDRQSECVTNTQKSKAIYYKTFAKVKSEAWNTVIKE